MPPTLSQLVPHGATGENCSIGIFSRLRCHDSIGSRCSTGTGALSAPAPPESGGDSDPNKKREIAARDDFRWGGAWASAAVEVCRWPAHRQLALLGRYWPPGREDASSAVYCSLRACRCDLATIRCRRLIAFAGDDSILTDVPLAEKKRCAWALQPAGRRAKPARIAIALAKQQIAAFPQCVHCARTGSPRCGSGP